MNPAPRVLVNRCAGRHIGEPSGEVNLPIGQEITVVAALNFVFAVRVSCGPRSMDDVIRRALHYFVLHALAYLIVPNHVWPVGRSFNAKGYVEIVQNRGGPTELAA